MTATGTARQALPSDDFAGRSLKPDRWRYAKHPRCDRDPWIFFEPNTSIQVGEGAPASKDSSMHVFDHLRYQPVRILSIHLAVLGHPN
jgi:hypothetical protein